MSPSTCTMGGHTAGSSRTHPRERRHDRLPLCAQRDFHLHMISGPWCRINRCTAHRAATGCSFTFAVCTLRHSRVSTRLTRCSVSVQKQSNSHNRFDLAAASTTRRCLGDGLQRPPFALVLALRRPSAPSVCAHRRTGRYVSEHRQEPALRRLGAQLGCWYQARSHGLRHLALATAIASPRRHRYCEWQTVSACQAVVRPQDRRSSSGEADTALWPSPSVVASLLGEAP